MGLVSPATCILPIPQRAHKEGSSFNFPPLDGTKTIPELFDWHFDENADYPVFVFKRATADKLEHVFYRDVIPAIHEAGWFVANAAGIKLDGPSSTLDPVAIIANTNTVTFFCTLVGLMRAGFPIVPISPVNSPEAAAHLLVKTQSRHVLVSQDPASQSLASSALQLIPEDSESSHPRILEMATFSDLFLSGSPMHRLPKRKCDLYDPAIYVHSSGSTALPKPVVWTHAVLLQAAATQCFGTDLRGEVMGVQGLSMSHASGIHQTISFLCVGGYVAATFPPEENFPVRTPDAVMQSYMDCRTTIIRCVPSYLQAWSEDPKAVEFLKTVKAIGFAGGPLSKETGDRLVKEGVPLSIVYGLTEAGVVARFFPEVVRDDWEYFEINPQCAAEFAHVEGDLYELVIVKRPTQELTIINSTWDGHDAYSTNDLLQKHPTKPGFWKIYGRADDQITLVNGLKTNAGPIESMVSSHPAVRSSVVFGRGQRNIGILVFPKQIEVSVSRFRDLIWLAIDKINKSGPKHAHIFKEMILVADASRRELKTDKGTVRRGATLSIYADEIQELYRKFEASVHAIIPAPTSWDLQSTTDFVRSVVCHVLGHIDDNQDIFDVGCASLQAFWISNSTLHAVGKSASESPRNFIYQHRTISDIAQYIMNLAHGVITDRPLDFDRRKYLDGFVDRFTVGFDGAKDTKKREDVIVVTGTTGALGNYILAHLVACGDVRTVYALNRASLDGTSLIERQVASLTKRGLDGQIASSPKVKLLEVDLENPILGLCDPVLQDIKANVTHIIHNAWPVNFNLSLKSFLDAITGVRTLVDFALSSNLLEPPRLIFISSMGIFRHKTFSPDRVSEEFIDDGEVVSEQGYSESKWISERVLAASARQTTLRPIVLRMDQITGGLNGAWNTSEWFPVLIRTSLSLEVIPILHGVARWISLDVAAAAVLDCRDSSHDVLHITHPRPVSLEFIMSTIAQELDIPTCPYIEWLSKLEEQATDIVDIDDAELLPALKAMDFYRSLKDSLNGQTLTPTHVEGRAHQESGDLREATSITESDVRQWVTYWKSTGMI